ncbi:MAG: TetR/AcrR family transcriptional regulator [Treponema sp.]|nr:TetR/AcrR family transcriptional regulator [Treponema sp.]
MGISERREREKVERRKAILKCARELILLNGVHRVSMEDIARKAELSKATVYLYFSSKEILFNEICEESARSFLEHCKPFLETGLTGMAALRCFWRGYMELFGNFDEMILTFKVRNYLDSNLMFLMLQEQNKSHYVDFILETIKTNIDECKVEGVFDPDLDSAMATRLLLSMFFSFIEKAACVPMDSEKIPAIIKEMTSSFQILVHGFAKEGIDRSSLSISGA